MPEQLDVPSLPVELSHVWEWWCQLNSTRSISVDISRITFTEIKSWSELYNFTISPFELDCIMAIETVFMRVRAEQMARKRPTQDQGQDT